MTHAPVPNPIGDAFAWADGTAALVSADLDAIPEKNRNQRIDKLLEWIDRVEVAAREHMTPEQAAVAWSALLPTLLREILSLRKT